MRQVEREECRHHMLPVQDAEKDKIKVKAMRDEEKVGSAVKQRDQGTECSPGLSASQ